MTTPYIEEVQVLQGKKHGKIALSVGGTLVGIPDGFGFDVLATFPNALKEVDRRAREEERERIFKKLWEREDIHPASLIQSLYPEKLEDLTPNP